MMIMLGCDGSGFTHYAAGKFPGRVGWLMGPKHWKPPRPWLPYACDNDAFTCRENWSETNWFDMLDHARLHACNPRWLLVPDVIADRDGTLARWNRYARKAQEYGWPLAFAVQDGMSPGDVPSEAALVFIGGSTSWKWHTLKMWCATLPRVHVGRVNNIDKVWLCDDLGVESVDGTGWIRNPNRADQIPALLEWLEGKRRPYQHELRFV